MSRGITALKIVRHAGETEIRAESKNAGGSKFVLRHIRVPHEGKARSLGKAALEQAVIDLLTKTA